MKNPESEHDDLLPEYDLDALLKDDVRGKYAARYREGTNLVLLNPEVAAAFPSAEVVNKENVYDLLGNDCCVCN